MWAIIDIGSNTVRLVVYTLENGKINPMLNKKYSAALAGYVDGNGMIKDEGIQKLLSILLEIRKILSYISVKEVFPFATASLRNSVNGREIVSLIREKCGFDVRILTGKEEAVFDYYGVIGKDYANNGIVVDVGGGSTELTFFKGDTIITATSIPLGSLQLYKTFVDGIIPNEKEAKKIKKEVRGFLEEIVVPDDITQTETIYSVGGTARASLRVINEIYARPENCVSYTRNELKHFLSDVNDRPEKMLKSISLCEPDRIHTIIPGLLIFETISKFYDSKDFIISDYGVREGFLTHMLKEKGELHA